MPALMDMTELPARRVAFMVVNFAGLFLTIPLVLIRLYIRTWISKTFGVDDIMLGVAQVLFTGTTVLGVVLSVKGYGEHTYDLTTDEKTTIYKTLYAQTILMYLSIIFLKLSVCNLFLRITHVIWHRRLIYAIAGTSTFTYLIVLFARIFCCWPVWYLWTTSAVWTRHCLDVSVIKGTLYALYSVSFCADWLLSMLSLLFLKDSIVIWKAKTLACCLVTLGLFASSTSIVCITSIPTSINTTDYTHSSAPMRTWATTEPLVGLVAISLVAFRPLFKSLLSPWHIEPSAAKDRHSSLPWQSDTKLDEKVIRPRRVLQFRDVYMPPPFETEVAEGVKRSYAEVLRGNQM